MELENFFFEIDITARGEEGEFLYLLFQVGDRFFEFEVFWRQVVLLTTLTINNDNRYYNHGITAVELGVHS